MGQINAETDSELEVEDDGDFTVTFSMTLPRKPEHTDES